MKSPDSREVLIWAVDPFERPPTATRSSARAIRAFSGSRKLGVLPVFVNQFENLPADLDVEALARRKLKSILGSFKISGLGPLEAINARARNRLRRRAAQALIEFAQERKAALIVLATHGRGGVKRLLLGSFAETLALFSPVPLLIVHPSWRATPVFKAILFPTDFSNESELAFRKLLQFARANSSVVTVFHRIGVLPYPIFQPAYVMQSTFVDELAESEKQSRQRSQRWAEIAAKEGVKVEIVIDKTRGGALSDSIIQRAVRLKALIALASQSGLGTVLLMGSTVREVIRKSPQPVWVVHPSR